MPLRVISYDGAAYRAQLSNDGHRELYPVVTLVLYFGTERHWRSPRTLKGRLKATIPNDLAPFVNNYKINLFELAWLNDKEVAAFKGDFHDVVEFLRCQRMHIPYEGTDRQVRHIHEVLELLKLISADEAFTKVEPELLCNKQKEKEGGMTMYNMVQAIREQGIAIGERQGFVNGERQGFANGRNSLYTLLSTLQAEGRSEELAHILSDRSYMEQLMEKQAEPRT